MQLSKRLSAVASLAGAGRSLADVGTDHGYIPISLIEEGKFERGLAMDVREGPLKRAEENIRRHGLCERIGCRLSDGVLALSKGEADTVVIAGMGGALIVRILTQGEEVLRTVPHLVLQPQSELLKVRKFLQEKGYRIEKEHMVFDEGKYYQAMRVSRLGMEKLSLEEEKYGPLLIREKDACLLEYLTREERKFQEILASMEKNTGERAAGRRQELREELLLIGKAKERMK